MTVSNDADHPLTLPAKSLQQMAASIGGYLQEIASAEVPALAQIAIQVMTGIDVPQRLARIRARATEWRSDLSPKLLKDIPGLVVARGPGIKESVSDLQRRLSQKATPLSPARRDSILHEIDRLKTEIDEFVEQIGLAQSKLTRLFDDIIEDHRDTQDVLGMAERLLKSGEADINSTYKDAPIDDLHIRYAPSMLFYRSILHVGMLNTLRRITTTQEHLEREFSDALEGLTAIQTYWRSFAENLTSVATSLRKSSTITPLLVPRLSTALANWERLDRYVAATTATTEAHHQLQTW